MPGFLITNIDTEVSLYGEKDAKLHRDSAKCGPWRVERSTVDMFMNDKLFLDSPDRFIVLEGVVLNKGELTEKYGQDTWADTVTDMIKECGREWFSQLIGPVSGAVYDKAEDNWCIFTGKLGEKAVFYTETSEGIIAGSQLKYLTDIMRSEQTERVADENALCHLAVYASYIGEETCLKNVKRLYPGHYLTVSDGVITTHEYYSFDIKQDEGSGIRSESEYIDRLTGSFNTAMQRILDKSREYGYKTLLDVSGGYDSRMNAYVLNDLRTDDDQILAACYGQSGCHDARVSKRLADELGYEYMFLPLDDAKCMWGVDDNVRMLNGATVYFGITGGRDLLRKLSGTGVGLEITGLLGDIYYGSMALKRQDGEIDIEDFRESHTLQEGVDYTFPTEENDRFRYHVNDHFWFYNRGMICGMGSFFIRQNYVEPVTPFGDPEFLKEFYSIPWDMRVKGRLPRKWILNKYPASGNYTNEKSGVKLKYEVGSFSIFFGKIYKQLRKIYRKLFGSGPDGMNDIDVWYREIKEFRDYVDENASAIPDAVKNCPSLMSAMEKLNASGDVYDKLIMMTINSIFRIFIE